MSAERHHAAPAPEFSRPFDCRNLPDKPRQVDIEATAAERKALADRFGIPAIQGLRADLTLTRRPGDVIAVAGRFTARVEQVCVVTLELFVSDVEEDFEIFFGEEGDSLEDDAFLPLDDEDLLEPVVGGRIDLGETVAQQLSLALDPHPRAPGVAFDAEAAGVGGDEGEEENEKPLAALRRLNIGGQKND